MSNPRLASSQRRKKPSATQDAATRAREGLAAAGAETDGGNSAVGVSGNSVAGSDAFVPDGVPRLSLDELERRRAPYIEPPLTTWVTGLTLEVGDERVVRGSASYRSLAADGGITETDTTACERAFGAEVRGQHDHRVGEVDRATATVGE